ncbi:MAG: glycoside hydrolase family 31 protein [Chloroflexota bacterium]
MRIVQSTDVKRHQYNETTLSFIGGRGNYFSISILDDDLIRVQHLPDGEYRLSRTWMIVDSEGDTPREGRSRDDLSPFPCPAFKTSTEEHTVTLQTKKLIVSIELGDFSLNWADDTGQPFAADLQSRGYPYDVGNGAVYHYMERFPGELYYGLGEVSGRLNKGGRSFRFFNLDALGYNAESGNPLYKHFPFYIAFNPETKIAYGILYDNLATTEMNFGQELDNYYPGYLKYMAEGGDIDYYLMYGPTIEKVIEKMAQLTGKMHLPPRWSLGYLGSTMSYTDAPDAQEQLKKFVDLCQEHEIPCDLFHLSSGFGTGKDGKRYVFNWNNDKVPEPKKMVDYFHSAGIHLAANIKPCLLTTHPRYEELLNLNCFIKEAESPRPRLEKFWGGMGAHIDFTHPSGYEWWKARVKDSILEYGIDSTWNDNNEYPIEDDEAVCHGFGEAIPIGLVRPLHALLMNRASYEAQTENRPNERPYLITRSGSPSIQRYSQTWSGDNRTNWHTLRFNVPMGLGLSLSGMPNTGHDVGGFAGNKPDAELFVRWVQNGIFHPRFTIHSWNDDGTVNEPWMHPEVLDIVRDSIRFRYQLMPYIYSLFFEAAATGHPIIRPLVYHFPHDKRCQTESFDFMLGPNMLIASVFEPGLRSRPVYLPENRMWCDFHSGTWYRGGQTIEVSTPLEQIPLFAPSGAILPMAKPMRYVGEQPDDVRRLFLFPGKEERTEQFNLVEDDGVSMNYQKGEFCDLKLTLSSTIKDISFTCDHSGNFELPYDQLELVLPPNEERSLEVADMIEEWVDDKHQRHIRVQVPKFILKE